MNKPIYIDNVSREIIEEAWSIAHASIGSKVRKSSLIG